MRIAVCAPQVPFEHGGTEILAETLTEELRNRDHEAELVRIPFKWYPGARPLREALLWRLVDLGEAQGRPIDMVIATKFPSYAIRHPNKVVWLVHQFRQAYDLDRTELGQFGEDPSGRATVRAIQRLDRTTLGEARRLFAISGNVAERLRRSTDLEAEVLVPPPQQLAFRTSDGVGTFILSVGRLDRAKPWWRSTPTPAGSRGRRRSASPRRCRKGVAADGQQRQRRPHRHGRRRGVRRLTAYRRLRAFDAKTGKELWSARLDAQVNANPMTYRGKNGKQYVAAVATDSLVVFALP